MGIILFLANIIKPKNWPLLIFLLLNLSLISFLSILITINFDLKKFAWTFEVWELALYAIGLYLIIWFIFLTPIGEIFFRITNRFKRIKRDDYNKEIYEVFDEVYDKAKAKSKLLSKKVKLYYYEDDNGPNAIALGRRTIAISTDLDCYLSKEETKGVLAHELGHLASGDSLMNMALLASNIVLLLVVTFIKYLFLLAIYLITFIIYCFLKVRPEDRAYAIAGLFSTLVSLIYTLWILFGKLLMLATSRMAEYKADNYAKKIGYGSELSSALVSIDPSFEFNSSMLELVTQSHPDTNKRLEKLAA